MAETNAQTVCGLEIHENVEPCYKALVYFEGWRQAIMNYGPASEISNIDYLERHMETDETFLLLTGTCTLFLGGEGASPSGICPVKMVPGKIYNIKKGVWHTCAGTPGSSWTIVENAATSRANSPMFGIEKGSLKKYL